MASWLRRTQAGIQSAPTSAAPVAPGSALVPSQTNARFRDPNAPDVRLDVESKCIYERRLPGNAYITGHVTRLQEGFYDSPSTHGDTIDNVRFLSLNFVFHPSETINRFQAASITVSLHDDTNQSYTDPLPPSHRLSAQGPPVPRRKPKFLRFAPHVMFGAVSPETLDWNFNLTGSLGVSQTPVSASLAPVGGIKGSYKVYQMMRLQGSTRTVRNGPLGDSSYDIEDGEVVWTMEENPLQKSGLPREMTFVMLITKGDVDNVVFDINIEARVAAWFGHYPKFWMNFLRYQPIQKEHMDLDRELGQRFQPTVPGRGFNFANLMGTFNDFVALPGTTYSVLDQALASQIPSPSARPHKQQRHAKQIGQDPWIELSGQDSERSQPQSHHQRPPRSPSLPPQQPARQSQASRDEPMDYHIYLHNPRSINLHATPPPQSNSAPPVLNGLSLHNPLDSTDPIPRPQTAIPHRMKSPANTKMKRRSIDISYMGANPLSPSHSQSGLGARKVSPGSLRRSRSRTDLRSSPQVEDHHSGGSQISTSPTPSNKENVPPLRSPSDPEQPAPIPSSPPQITEDILIPMQAPSPPNTSNILSPPLPSWRGTGAQPKGDRLPFELNKPIRPTHTRTNSGGSGGRVVRSSRSSNARDNPSPMRPCREITPSPNEESINMRDSSSSETSPQEPNSVRHPGHRLVMNSTRREREISPYAAAALANGVGLAGGAGVTDWDEAKGDLKELRARKRYSLPAQYSYITHEEDADRGWEER